MMSSNHLMVVLIVAIVMVASVLRARYSHRRHGDVGSEPGLDQAEKMRLREEVRELKERLKVLERIAVEKENSLAREIDQLRDR